MSELAPCRILYIAASSSVHTQKWCQWFAGRGHDVHVATFDSDEIPGVTVHHMKQSPKAGASDPRKIAYLSRAAELRRIVAGVRPHIVHAHYASSYGALAALAVEQPYYLSVWGSDVYEFPRRSPLHRALLKYALKKATWLMSTSQAMANEASRYTDKAFDITPFGVDTRVFRPLPQEKPAPDHFTVGTVKGLDPKYGIATLLEGCALALLDKPGMPLRVRIAGKGPQEGELRELAAELGMAERIEWLGFVDAPRVPAVWRSLNVAVVPSAAESFGVAAVEAQACGVPVVVSSIPGLMEATCPAARIVIDCGDAAAVGRSLVDLYDHPERRCSMGEAGRLFVNDHLALAPCFERVERSYVHNMERGHE